jgi:hypothetical protein
MKFTHGINKNHKDKLSNIRLAFFWQFNQRKKKESKPGAWSQI